MFVVGGGVVGVEGILVSVVVASVVAVVVEVH